MGSTNPVGTSRRSVFAIQGGPESMLWDRAHFAVGGRFDEFSSWFFKRPLVNFENSGGSGEDGEIQVSTSKPDRLGLY